MMKKVLFGVAMALLACGSVGTLQSCKDDVSDLKTQTAYDLDALQKAMKLRADGLQDQITANRNNIVAIYNLLGQYATVKYVDDKIQDVKGIINHEKDLLWDGVNKNASDISKMSVKLDGAILKFDQIADKQATQIAHLFDQIAYAQERIDAIDEKLANEVASLREAIGANADAITELTTRVEIAEAKIEALEEFQKEALEKFDAIDSEMQNMKDQIADNSANIDILKGKLIDLKNDLKELKDRVDLLEPRVDELEKGLEQLTNKVDNLVTAVLIQSVNSPVFGDFSLPIGVKSNLVFNWYGYNGRGEGFNFPSMEWGYNVNGNAGVNFNGAATEFIPDGEYTDNLTLGTVYVTLNPLGNNFEGTNVQIVNSLGDPLPVKVTALRPTEKKLMHGFTRADEIAAAVYEADIVLDTTNEEAMKAVRLSIDDSLETSMKDALKDPSKRTAVALMKALYDQMSGKLPAYALQYDWTVNATEENPTGNYYRVLSQYDLAVATARPLSYNFLQREGNFTDKELPIISDIDNIITNLKGKVEIKIEPLEAGAIEVDLKDVTVDVSTGDVVMVIPDIAIIEGGQFKGTTYDLVLGSPEKPEGVNKDNLSENQAGIDFMTKLGVTAVNGKTYKYEQITGLANLAGDIKSGIESGLKNAGTQISTDITTEINTKIIDKINAELKTQIDGTIDDLANDFQPFFDKANRAFDIYNKIATKVNRFLKNPNAYLQATALYSMNGNYGFVSGSPTSPSYFKGNGDFNIFLTSYTGELIVPAYKKYVAITGKVVNGKVVSEPITSGLNSGDLNKVLDGNQIKVTVPASKLSAGTYEFTYQAVDYRGYTSTRKFYVNIDK